MTDIDLIRELGGPTQLAVRLGFDKAKGGVQRVQNWIARGRIPAQVKLDHPDLFSREAGQARKSEEQGTGDVVRAEGAHA